MPSPLVHLHDHLKRYLLLCIYARRTLSSCWKHCWEGTKATGRDPADHPKLAAPCHQVLQRYRKSVNAAAPTTEFVLTVSGSHMKRIPFSCAGRDTCPLMMWNVSGTTRSYSAAKRWFPTLHWHRVAMLKPSSSTVRRLLNHADPDPDRPST